MLKVVRFEQSHLFLRSLVTCMRLIARHTEVLHAKTLDQDFRQGCFEIIRGLGAHLGSRCLYATESIDAKCRRQQIVAPSDKA